MSAFSAAGVELLVVGAHALAAHGRPRSTGALDLWVRPVPENAERVLGALARFGAPLGDLTGADLATPELVFQIGIAPNRVDVLTSIDGVSFEEAWPARISIEVEGLAVPVLGRANLIRNKRAAGRPQDRADVAWLEAHARE